MTAPTLAQQRGLAIAPIPFAASSFLSSSYVIYYLVWKQRQKLKRLYHRLVLAMNVALLPLSFTYIWSSFAIPEGTPNYYGASGTIQTCTAQGRYGQQFFQDMNVFCNHTPNIFDPLDFLSLQTRFHKNDVFNNSTDILRIIKPAGIHGNEEKLQ